MCPPEALPMHRTRIREIALSHRVSGEWMFGSALQGDDVAGSDLDLLGLDVGVLTPSSLPASFREQVLCEAVPWSFAYEMCNALSHGYFEVDLAIVWQTVQHYLPALRAQVTALKLV